MSAKQLQAVARDRAGKGAARAVRREGRVPAVIYGGGEPAQSISLDSNQTKQLIFAGQFLTTVFEIDVDGRKTRAIPRDYQLDPVRDFPVHVDFLRLSKGQTIKVVVPVHVVGQENSPGVKRGGTVNIVEHSIELLVPSDSIPDSVEASVANLDIGSSIHIEDIKLPNGAKATSTENLTLVTVVAPSGMQEEEPAAATEAAPAAPAAKAPAAKG
jgi:large subunit ribosomal protein L25